MGFDVSIIGAFNTKFGKLEDQTIYILFEEAAKGAIKDAGIDTKQVDAVFVGNYSGEGMLVQRFLSL